MNEPKEKVSSPLGGGGSASMTRSGSGGKGRGRERGRTISEAQAMVGPTASTSREPSKQQRALSSSPPHAGHAQPRRRSSSRERLAQTPTVASKDLASARPNMSLAAKSTLTSAVKVSGVVVGGPFTSAEAALSSLSQATPARRSSEDRHDTRRDEVFSRPSLEIGGNQPRSAEERAPGGAASGEVASVLKTPAQQNRALPTRVPPLADRLAALKKVHFTGSVKGGLSSIASVSPPSSPPHEQQSWMDSQRGPVQAVQTDKDRMPPPALSQASRAPSTPAFNQSALSRPGALLTLAAASINHARQNSDSTMISSSLASHQRTQSDSTKISTPSVADRSARISPPIAELTIPKKASPEPLSQSLPIPIPLNGRLRSQSIGYPSTVGSAGSYNTTIAPSVLSKDSLPKESPRRMVAQLPSVGGSSTSPSTSPQLRTTVVVPPISRTLPAGEQANAQQPTPSPTPPKHQILSVSPSKASAAMLPPPPNLSFKGSSPTPSLRTINPAPVPPSPVLATKPISAHPATPFARQDNLPGELSREVRVSAMKHTQYAMSALEYYDVETARRELRLALSTLE